MRARSALLSPSRAVSRPNSLPFPTQVNDKSTDWEQKFLNTNLCRAFQPKVALAFKKKCLPPMVDVLGKAKSVED